MSVKVAIVEKINQAMKQFNIPGLGLVLISPDLSGIKTFGYADLETKRRINKKSLWQLASISKNISATCLAWMVEKGEASYTDKINNKHCQRVKFENKFVAENVNIRDCMSHTTGLQTQSGTVMSLYKYDINTIYNSFRYYNNVGFRTLFNYTNEAFTLGFQTACCLNHRSIEKQFEEFFKEFGMNHSITNYGKISTTGNRVVSYLDTNAIPMPTKPFHQETFIPAGGVASTLSDLGKYLQIHLQKKIKGLDKIYSRVVVSGIPNGEYYGIGTAINELVNNTVYSHEGLFTTGFSHIVFYDVVNHIGFAILTNSVNPVPGALALYIYLQLLGYPKLAEKAYNIRIAETEADLSGLSCKTEQTYFKNPHAICARSTDKNVCIHCDELDICTPHPMNFFNDKYGQISIQNGMITVGNLEPVIITITNGTLFFTIRDINNQPLNGTAQFAKGNCSIILNTNINCLYAMYVQIQ